MPFFGPLFLPSCHTFQTGQQHYLNATISGATRQTPCRQESANDVEQQMLECEANISDCVFTCNQQIFVQLLMAESRVVLVTTIDV
jgi:hypothetical protein